MTTTASETTNPATPDPADWNAKTQDLQARFPGNKDSILFAIHALQQDPDATVDQIKAQAGLHEIRVTAATVGAAKKLLAPVPAASAHTTAADATPARQRPVRRVRPAPADLDPTVLIQHAMDTLRAQGAAEVERMRGAMQKAIAVLQAAAG